MENWSAVIYRYRRGELTKQQALHVAKCRLTKLVRGSPARKTMRKFIDELEAAK